MYLFHLIVLLNPDFNFSKKLLSSFVDKVTTGTYNFVFVILYIAFVRASILSLAGLSPWAALVFCVVMSVKTQFSDQVKVKDTSQLIKGISRLLDSKNYLNILMEQQFLLFSWFAFDIFLVILLLYLKDSEFVMGLHSS